MADVVLRRVRPQEEDVERVATERLPFRAFRTRQVKDGHFVLAVEPGAYEVARIVGDGWGAPVLAPSEDARRATRFTVTRPCVVDLGVIHFARDGFGTYTMALRAPPDAPARAAALRAIVAGTPWERLQKSEVAR